MEPKQDNTPEFRAETVKRVIKQGLPETGASTIDQDTSVTIEDLETYAIVHSHEASGYRLAF